MKALLGAILALSISSSVMAKSLEIVQADGILTRSVLTSLLAGSGKLQAVEFEHDKVVNKLPVSLILAMAIQSGAKISNNCLLFGNNLECTVKIENKDNIEELIVSATAVDHENGAKITKVIYKTL